MAPVGLTRWQESLLFAELGRGAVSPGFQGPLQSENTEAEPCRGDASCVSRGQAPGPEVTPRSPEGREQTMAAFRPAAVARRTDKAWEARPSLHSSITLFSLSLLYNLNLDEGLLALDTVKP